MGEKRIILSSLITVAVLLIVGIAIFATRQSAETPDHLLSLGEKYLTELNYEQALVQFLKVIEIDPMNPRGYSGAAESYVGLGQTDEAVAILRQGLERTGDDEIRDMLNRIEEASIDETNFESTLPKESILKPEQIMPHVSTYPIEQRATKLDMTEFSYSNLSYSFEWREGFAGNENAIGGCLLEYQIEGDLTNAVTTRIAYGSPKNDWTTEAIYEHAEYITGIWKSEGSLNGNSSYDNYTGYVSGSGFPIDEDELGITGDVLCIVLDENYDAIGYVLIPVTIPLR